VMPGRRAFSGLTARGVIVSSLFGTSVFILCHTADTVYEACPHLGSSGMVVIFPST
jgi:hypothetical protein